jgi:hypothetical protein
MNPVRFRYRGPAEQLRDRLARLHAHRRHVTDELRGLQRFLAENPDLRTHSTAREGPRLRLVVDNTPR